MKNPHKYSPITSFSLIFLFLFCSLVPMKAYSQAQCAKGVGVPPFLGEGLDPDLLLIIDNSGSMLDLAYVDPDHTCLDDTYASGETYAGYFEENEWYLYNFVTNQFEPANFTDVETQDFLDNADFKTSDLGIYGAVVGGELTSVTKFGARGNFLNWAMASKLDIQKKILTGGKYSAATGRLIMESRGCGARRHSKVVEVMNSAGVGGFQLNLGISPPPEWRPGKNYSAGDMVMSRDIYYITNAGGVSCGTDVLTDTCVNWIQSDISLTHVEIFKITTAANGVDYGACEDAVANLGSDSPNLGQLIQDTGDCLGFAANNTIEGYSNAALNHSLQNCWYLAKHEIWQPGSGSVLSIQNICEKLYGGFGLASTDPWDIEPSDSGYVCYGVWAADPADRLGYVGRCWDPGAGAIWTCTKTHPVTGECTKGFWSGGAGPGWVADDYDCIDQALKDFCGVMEVPEVIDPSDLVGDDPGTEDTLWNIPAILISAAMGTNLREPIAVLKGFVQAPQPDGLIHEFASSIRMGAMIFNDSGSESECVKLGDFAQDDCGADPGDSDGGKIISYIDQSPAHTVNLVTAINDIQATAWTPIAEAMYNAIGYYTQNGAMCLNPGDDFVLGNDPVQAYCQHKNILIITEGSSTADLNSDVADFVAQAGQNDEDAKDGADCGVLAGSTFLDDLTHYAYETKTLFPPPPPGEEIRNIFTHIVVSGTLRDLGDSECSPDVLLEAAAKQGGTTLYNAADPAMLEITLRNLFFALSTRASAGSAASVISSSRGGEGATYQAIFWPRVEFFEGGIMNEITWTGEVHALFVDAYGKLYEDTDEDRTLDSAIDEHVVFYFDITDQQTKVCYGDMNPDGTCNGTVKGLKQVRYLWSAAEWLADITPTESVVGTDILKNRNQYISTEKNRYIFTWNDLDNDGIVDDANEVLPFVSRPDWENSLLSPAQAAIASRGLVPLDFGVQTSAEVNEIVRWIRGEDQMGLRSRRVPHDLDRDGIDETFVTWRLGDVIHSTPMSVSSPNEGLHLLYKDPSYAEFVAKYKKRRHVVYFGGNDGMLHAVNSGFYNENYTKFCRNGDCLDEGEVPGFSPELGAELWAYVPYNLLPHLKCLTQDGYAHKYFVDQRVRIFDVRIFPDDAIHKNGWGTILVGAMGFGGAKVEAESFDVGGDGIDDKREFTSAYFVLDITDPEQPPVLLGEMTRTTVVDAFGADVDADLAYTLPIPTIVTMKDGPDTSDTTWYLMLGSGPTGVNGTSTQNASLAVIPLNGLVDKTTPFRIPDVEPSVANNEMGRFLLDPDSFISDLITVDFELEPNYKADAVYFGTVSGDWAGWGGKLYRLVTRKLDAFDAQEVTIPSQWSSLINPLANPIPLIDANKPITASPTVAYDGKNYWIYFGTGRFFDINDKSDGSQQSYYGIKEPMSFAGTPENCKGTFTWETVEEIASGLDPGSLGLTPVGDIRVSASGAILRCIDGTTDCLPKEADGITPLPDFDALEDYISGTGTGCDAADLAGTDGWYRDFHGFGERNLGQAALLGGLLSFTTYQPYDDICRAEGQSFLYGIAYKTGTAYYPDVFGVGPDPFGNVVDRIDLGKGLAVTPNLHVGKSMGTKAFVQTSTGAIVEIPQPGTPKSPGTGLTGWSDE